MKSSWILVGIELVAIMAYFLYIWLFLWGGPE